MKKSLIVANWKLNGNKKTIKELIYNIKKNISPTKNCEIVIAPPVIYLDYVKKLIDNTKITLAAQNVDENLTGAFTGEISVDMLKDIGVKYVIIGHSERKKYHLENKKSISQKFFLIKSANLIPILCIGETKEEHSQGKTQEICKKQIDYIIKNQGISVFENTVIAYEPIWAIGTGYYPNKYEINNISTFIRKYFKKKNKKISDSIIIQYGGSINEKNIKEIFSSSNLNGALVGNASLNGNIFCNIINKISNIKES